MTAPTITREEFNKLTPAQQANATQKGYVIVEPEIDLFNDDFSDLDVATASEEELPVKPLVADYSDKQAYLASIVEWLSHKKQEPVLLNNTVTLATHKFNFNPMRLNTKFNLVNEYDGKKFYRMDEIKYCLAVLSNGADKVNELQNVEVETSVGYTRTGSLADFEIQL